MKNSRELNVTHLKRPAVVLAKKNFLSNDEMTDALVELLNNMYPADVTGGAKGDIRAILALLDKDGKSIIGTRYIDFDMQLYLKYDSEYLPNLVFNPKGVSPRKVVYGTISDNNIHNYEKGWEDSSTESPKVDAAKVKAETPSAEAQVAIEEVIRGEKDSVVTTETEGYSYRLYLFKYVDHDTLKKEMALGKYATQLDKIDVGYLKKTSAYLTNATPLDTVFVSGKGPSIDRSNTPNSELQVIHYPSRDARQNKVMPEAISKYFSEKSLKYKHSAYVWTFTLKPGYNLLVLPRERIHGILSNRVANYKSYTQKINELTKLAIEYEQTTYVRQLSDTREDFVKKAESKYDLEKAIYDDAQYSKSLFTKALIRYRPQNIIMYSSATSGPMKAATKAMAYILGSLWGATKWVFTQNPKTPLQQEREHIEQEYRTARSLIYGNDAYWSGEYISVKSNNFSKYNRVLNAAGEKALAEASKKRADELAKFKENNPNADLKPQEQLDAEIKKYNDLAYNELAYNLKKYNINSLLYDAQITPAQAYNAIRLCLGNVTNNAADISIVDFKLRYYILLFQKILQKIEEKYQYFIDNNILRIAPLNIFNQLKDILLAGQDINITLQQNAAKVESLLNNLPTNTNPKKQVGISVGLPSVQKTQFTKVHVDKSSTAIDPNDYIKTKQELCKAFENVLFNPWAGMYISTDYKNKKYNSLYNITPTRDMFLNKEEADMALSYRNEDIESITISRAANSASSSSVSIKNKDEKYYILENDETKKQYYKHIGTCVFEEMDELLIYLPKYYMSNPSDNTLDLCFRGIIEQVEYVNSAGYHSISLRAKCPIKYLEMSRTNVKPSYSTKTEANSMHSMIPYHVFSMPPEFLNSLPYAIAWMLTQGLSTVFCQPKAYSDTDNITKLISKVPIDNPDYQTLAEVVNSLSKQKNRTKEQEKQLAETKDKMAKTPSVYQQVVFADPLYTYLWYVNNSGGSVIDRMVIERAYKELLNEYTATQYYNMEQSSTAKANTFQYQEGIHIYKDVKSKTLLKNPTYYIFRYRKDNSLYKLVNDKVENIDRLLVARVTGTYQPAFDIAFSQADIRVSDYKTNYELLKEISDKYNFALYSDKSGIITFCPINVSLFNLNSANSTCLPDIDKMLKISSNIEEEERYNPQVFTQEKVITYRKRRDDSKVVNWIVVNGIVPMVNELDRRVGNLAIIQSRPLIRRYGIRAQKSYSLLGANSSAMCYCYGLAMLDRQNKLLVSAQIDALFDSSFEINNPVYCTSDNTVYYADGVNISYKPGGTVTMSISCSYGRTPLLKIADYVKKDGALTTVRASILDEAENLRNAATIKYTDAQNYIDTNIVKQKATDASLKYWNLETPYSFNKNEFISAVKKLYRDDEIAPSTYSQLVKSASSYLRNATEASNDYYFVKYVLPTIAYNGYVWDYIPSILFEDLIYDNLALYRGADIASAYLQTSENTKKLLTLGQLTDSSKQERADLYSEVVNNVSASVTNEQAAILQNYVIAFISPYESIGKSILFQAIDKPLPFDLKTLEMYVP